MTANSRYTDSESEINTKSQTGNWKPIGDLAKVVVKHAERAAK